MESLESVALVLEAMGGMSKEYKFTQDWFSYNPVHIAVWEKHLASYAGQSEVHYLEIGTFEGRSLVWMLEHILTHLDARAVGIDRFGDGGVGVAWPKGVPFEICMANLRASGFSHKVLLLKGLSQDLLPTFGRSSFDIIYVDGSHEPADTLTDAVLSWPLLKLSGIMVFDDYGFRAGVNGQLAENPRLGIDSFLSAFQDKLEVLDKYYQVFIRKVKP